tara:strand:+ start:2509 stop:3462 length:954 start_codon:yes stop_codon:yes gene_type:complete
MPFIPKSQYTKKYTNGGEFVYKNKKNKSYKGPYIIYNKKYYTGTNSFDMGAQLIKSSPIPKLTQKKTTHSYPSRIYKILKPKIKEQLINTLLVPSSKPSPSFEEYSKGSFLRYFAKRINGNSYREIDKETFNHIKKKDYKYDHNLYEVGVIKWFITGPNIHSRNSTQLKMKEKFFPNLFTLFPILNEHALTTTSNVQENLYTEGNELYYSNGAEYIGDYHIHPQHGPMVGATHSNISHDSLYHFEQLPSYGGNTYDEFVKNYNEIDCFKCILVPNAGGAPQITIQKTIGYRLTGCLQGTYPTSEEASNNCPNRTLEE